MSSRRHTWHNLGDKLLPRANGTDVESQTESRLEDPGTAQRGGGGGAAVTIPGAAALLAVAFLWGTYGVTLRVLYELPTPPHPAALTAVRGVIQSVSLFGTGLLLRPQTNPESSSKHRERLPSATMWRAGLEMGFWNFLATSLQAAGLEHTTAVRSGFIIQATSILTPLIATLAGESPTRNMWVGCGVALASTVLISLDSMDASKGVSATELISIGDAAVLGAAFFYSVTTVRLGFYAQQLPAISLASAKSYALTGFALLYLASLAWQRSLAGEPVAQLWQGPGDPVAWLLVFWAALGPGALAAFLQSKGQGKVSSSQAQIYYSSTPIWSALLAMLLLEGESMGPLGWLGGLGIVLAGLVASR